MTSIVTAKELGQFLKISESTIYKLASQNQLPGFKIGGSWRFDMDEVLERIRTKKRPTEMVPILNKKMRDRKKS
jgi:excisionase family DNA binding protein